MYAQKKVWKYMQKINAESWALMSNPLNQSLPFYKISRWFSSYESLECTALRNIKESVGHKKFLMKSQRGSLDTLHFLKLRNSVKYPREVTGIRSEPSISELHCLKAKNCSPPLLLWRVSWQVHEWRDQKSEVFSGQNSAAAALGWPDQATHWQAAGNSGFRAGFHLLSK